MAEAFRRTKFFFDAARKEKILEQSHPQEKWTLKNDEQRLTDTRLLSFPVSGEEVRKPPRNTIEC